MSELLGRVPIQVLVDTAVAGSGFFCNRGGGYENDERKARRKGQSFQLILPWFRLDQVQPRPRSYPLNSGAHSYVDFLQRGLVGLALRITFLWLKS